MLAANGSEDPSKVALHRKIAMGVINTSSTVKVEAVKEKKKNLFAFYAKKQGEKNEFYTTIPSTFIERFQVDSFSSFLYVASQVSSVVFNDNGEITRVEANDKQNSYFFGLFHELT